MTDRKSPQLDDAYALQTPEDSVRLYAGWAETYDSDFAEASDYILPEQVAREFLLAGGQGPVLDVGAGTGLCAHHLAQRGVTPIDATDISPEMLEIARSKNLYRTLFTGDLTAQLDVAVNTYAGVVSSGTFTNGHVGPEAIDELVRVTQPGGLLAISINGQHWQAAGFAAKFKELTGRISGLALPEVRFYGPGATGGHKDDTGFVATFRKA